MGQWATLTTSGGAASADGGQTHPFGTYFFTPPVGSLEPVGHAHPLWRRVKLDLAWTVVKESGAYRQVRNVSDDVLAAADAAYPGGRAYPVDPDEAAALMAAGYGEWVT